MQRQPIPSDHFASRYLSYLLSLTMISMFFFFPAGAHAEEATPAQFSTLADLVPLELAYLVGETDLSLWHEMNKLEKEQGPQGPHVKSFEFPTPFERRMVSDFFVVPPESADRILWAGRGDNANRGNDLLLIRTVGKIDMEKLKEDHAIDAEADTREAFEIGPYYRPRLAKLIAPNLLAIASDRKSLDDFLQFQKEPVATRKSAASLFSDPNFVFRFTQRKPPGHEDEAPSDEMMQRDPVFKLLAPLDRTVVQLTLQISFDDDHSLFMKLDGTFISAEAAKDASLKYKMGKAMLDQAFELYLEDTDLPPMADPVAVANWPHAISALRKLLDNMHAEVTGKQCVIQTECDQEFYNTLLAVVKRIPEQEARMNDLFRVQKILLALDHYHALHGHYPSSTIIDEESGHVRSWRVEMLPYLGDADLKELYEKYHKDQPWDSEENLKLLDASVSAFSSSWESDPHDANFFFVLGDGTPLQDEKSTRDEIKDPRGQTVLIVSADRDIPWTMPADVNLEESLELSKMGIWNNDQVLVGTADLTPLVLPANFSTESWQNLLLKADGHKVALPEQYRPTQRAKP